MTSPKYAVTTESGRYYTISGYESQTFYSVTTALNVLSKPALMKWAAKLVAERAYTAARDGSLAGMKREVALKFLKAAPGEFTKAAQDRGTEVHRRCEHYTLGDEIADDECGTYVNGYRMFLENEDIEILEQEMTVFNPDMNPEYGYAGTLDAIVKLNGKTYVMDIKTGGVYPSASLQMAAYAHATHIKRNDGTNEDMNYVIDGAFVLKLKPNGYEIHYMKIDGRQYITFCKALDLAIWNTETSREVTGDEYA